MIIWIIWLFPVHRNANWSQNFVSWRASSRNSEMSVATWKSKAFTNGTFPVCFFTNTTMGRGQVIRFFIWWAVWPFFQWWTEGNLLKRYKRIGHTTIIYYIYIYTYNIHLYTLKDLVFFQTMATAPWWNPRFSTVSAPGILKWVMLTPSYRSGKDSWTIQNPTGSSNSL